MSGRYWIAAGLIAFASPALAAEASPFDGIPNIKFDYYDIEGRTAAEIYASMRARAPRKGDGVAVTSWRLHAGWGEIRRGSRCEIENPATSLSIVVLLPRLITTEGVTDEGLAFWQSALRGLEIHEAGHARIAYDHRGDFAAAARKANCGSIKAVAARTQARIEKIQEDYDRETRHGMTQMPPIGE